MLVLCYFSYIFIGPNKMLIFHCRVSKKAGMMAEALPWQFLLSLYLQVSLYYYMIEFLIFCSFKAQFLCVTVVMFVLAPIRAFLQLA